MSEVLVLYPVGRIHPCLNLGVPNMSLLKHHPNPTSQVLGVHPIELNMGGLVISLLGRLLVLHGLLF
jgi:hypothetical protein